MPEANTAPKETPEPVVTGEDGKPKGHVNVGKGGRWAVRQAFGSERGQFLVDFVESFTPEQFRRVIASKGDIIGLIRDLIS